MPLSAWPAMIAALDGRSASARKKVGRLPKLDTVGTLAALVAIVAVPVLAALFPRREVKLVMPLLAITSVGVYLTVPDTEHVSVVMALVIMAAIVTFAASISPHPLVVGATAFVIMGAAIMDCGGREASIVRAAGCFGVVIAAPVSGWLEELRNGDRLRQPNLTILVVLHCVLVGWSSRALIRQESITLVVVADAIAFAVALIVLVVAARPVAAER